MFIFFYFRMETHFRWSGPKFKSTVLIRSLWAQPFAGVPLASVKTTKVPGWVGFDYHRERQRLSPCLPSWTPMASRSLPCQPFTRFADSTIAVYQPSWSSWSASLTRHSTLIIGGNCRYSLHFMTVFGPQNDGYDVTGILRVSAEELKVNRWVTFRCRQLQLQDAFEWLNQWRSWESFATWFCVISCCYESYILWRCVPRNLRLVSHLNRGRGS